MEQHLGVVNQAYVYKIPPARTTQGHYARDWDLEHPLTETPLRLRIVERNGDCVLKLEEASTGQLFAECIYSETSVQRVLDSSRYFVFTLTDENGRRAHLGVGFLEKSEAFDFNAAIDLYFRYKRQEEEAKRAAKEWEARPREDLSLKPGQTITVNIKNSKKKPGDNSSTRPGGSGFGAGAGGDSDSGQILLPPPPGSSTILPPPPANTSSTNPLFDPWSQPQPVKGSTPASGGFDDSSDWTDFSSSKSTSTDVDWTSFF